MSKSKAKTPAGLTPAPDAPSAAETPKFNTASVQIGPTPSLPGSRLKKK